MAALLASILLPTVAAAETVVPPGNSAATQYTEGFPTSGGNADANSGINAGNASPKKVLGHDNAAKLESKGQIGRDVAQLTAETAPVAVAESGGADHHGSASGDRSGAGAKSGGVNRGAAGSNHAQGVVRPIDASSGSSGFGEVVGQATGTSSGELGLFLPLIIIATVLWSLNYLRRQRRQVVR